MAKDKKRKGKSYLTKPLDKKSFKKEMRAAIREEFGAAQRDLQKETRISKATQRRNADYFGEYQAQLAQMQQQNQQGTQQALNQMGGFANQMIGQNQAVAGQVTQQNAQSAQARGATPGAQPQLQGQAGLVGQGTQMAGQIASQGQAQGQYLGGMETAAIQEKNAMRTQQQLVRRTVREELRNLKKDKGAAKSTYLSEAREGERRYSLAKRELKQSKGAAKQQRQQSNRGNKLTRAEARRNREFDRRQAEKDRKAGENGEKGDRTPTPKITSSLRDYIRGLKNKEKSNLTEEGLVDWAAGKWPDVPNGRLKKIVKGLNKSGGGKNKPPVRGEGARDGTRGN
jgi:hypothetical protein